MINIMDDSTNNRKKPPRRKASSSDEDKTTQLFHNSRNLVAETLPQDEANETTVDYNLISPPSLTSTPIPLDIDNDATVDFQVPITPLTNVANSRRISKIKGCTQFDFKAPSPKTLSKLPSSDSQFPVDFSFTQPHSPTLPSRSHSSVGDSSDVPSPSLLTLGKNGVVRNLEQGFDFTSPASSTSCKDKSCAVVDTKTLKQTTIPQVSSLWKRSSKDCFLRKRKRSYQDQESRVSKIEKHEVASDKQEIVTKQSVSEKDVIVLDDSCKLTSPGPDCSNLDLFDGIPGTPQGRVDMSEDHVDQEDIVCYDKNDEENVINIGNMQQQPPSSMEYRKQSDGPNYKFVEVVRKRDERAKLNGYTCEECEQYYRGLGLEEEEMRGRLKECSKHRARFSPPPNTPPDFWKLSFYETQEYNDKGFLKSESEVPRKPPRLKNDRNKYAAYIQQFNKSWRHPGVNAARDPGPK